MCHNRHESRVNISTNLLTISLSLYVKGVVATIRSFSSRSRLRAASMHPIPGCTDRVVFQYLCAVRPAIPGAGKPAISVTPGATDSEDDSTARDTRGLRCFSSECVRLRIKPLACLDERNSSVHPASLPTVTPSDRTQLAQRRGSVLFLTSLVQPHRDSEGGSTCRLGFGNMPY